MPKRKISKSLQKWRKRYADTFFGIEPLMSEGELLSGQCTVREYKDHNMNWIEDHFGELISGFE